MKEVVESVGFLNTISKTEKVKSEVRIIYVV